MLRECLGCLRCLVTRGTRLYAGQLRRGLTIGLERDGIAFRPRYGEVLLSEVERCPQPLSSVMGAFEYLATPRGMPETFDDEMLRVEVSMCSDRDRRVTLFDPI